MTFATYQNVLSKVDPAWALGGGMTLVALGVKAAIDAHALAGTAIAVGNGIAYVGIPVLGAVAGTAGGAILGATHGIAGSLLGAVNAQQVFAPLGGGLGASLSLNAVQATSGKLVPTIVSAFGIGSLPVWAPWAIAVGSLMVVGYAAHRKGLFSKLVEAYKEGAERYRAKPPEEKKKGIFASFAQGFRNRRNRKLAEKEASGNLG